MSNDLQQIVEQQDDIVKCKFLGSGKLATTFRVKQLYKGKTRKQVVRVIHNISNHYSVKREKDLLHYLNRFPEFITFNEIRKVGVHYLQFFDYVGKKTLESVVSKKGGLSQEKTRDLLADMVAVLDRAHRVGFVHGDIRPDNVILGKKQSYLVDWSSAFPSLSSYETEMVPSDALYLPPERMNGQHDEAGDVYSLGCTLYYALTGKHIYRLNKKSSLAEQLWAHSHHSVHKMNKLPIFWRYLIFWMTQKEPEKRPSLKELQAWIDDISVPDWVRKMSVRAEKSYPEEPMTQLADEHFLYPIFIKAQEHEQQGDLETAFNLYENGAFRDYSYAENCIGKMYEKGEPVKQSYAMAANMYHQAFEKGNPHAAFNLAKLFEQGLGMPVNQQHAFKLYKFAAMRGYLPAQNKVGDMYLKGIGITASPAQARSWFGLAASGGDEEAKVNIKRMLKQTA